MLLPGETEPPVPDAAPAEPVGAPAAAPASTSVVAVDNAPAGAAPEANPYLQFVGKGEVATPAPVPLGERVRLHIENAKATATILGAARELGDSAIARAARERGSIAELENEAITRAVKTREDLAKYELMPGADGFLEYGAAVLGSVIGGVQSPEAFIGNVLKLPALAAKGVFGRMAEFGVNQAIVNTATDPLAQGANLASGLKDKYDIAQTAMAPVVGFVMGGALKGAHEGAALFVKPQIEKDALAVLRMARDNPAEAGQIMPDVAKEVAGKSDVELAAMAKEVVQAEIASRQAAAPQAEPVPVLPAEQGIPPAKAPPEQGISPPERIVGAAVQAKDGRIFAGSTHSSASANAADFYHVFDPYEHGLLNDASLDGFLTSTGRLVDRKEALEIADKAKQAGDYDRASGALRGEHLHNLAARDRDRALELANRSLSATPRDQAGQAGGGAGLSADQAMPALGIGDRLAHAAHDTSVRLALLADKVGLTDPDVAWLPPHWASNVANVLMGPGDGARAMAVTAHEGSVPRPPSTALATTAPQLPATQTAPSITAPNIRDMWTKLAEATGAVVRQGRLVSKGASGEYSLASGVIRMKQADDPTVLAHEIGHHLEQQLGDPLKVVIDAHTPELSAITNYASGQKTPALQRAEGFAEFLRLFAENPIEARSRAPGFDAAFRTFIAGEPKLKAALETIQNEFANYRLANASDLVDANVHTSQPPTGWQKFIADVRNDGFANTIAARGSAVYAGLIDEKNALAVTVRELVRLQKEKSGAVVDLIAADDPYKLVRLASNAHQAGMVDLMHGVVPYRSIASEGASLHEAIALATGKPNIFSGWDEAATTAFGGYLTARRAVFEWERRAAGLLDKDPAPFSKDVYETKIAEYEGANPNARNAADMVYQWTRNLLRKEYEAGLISAETYNGALQIRDYVPLMRDMTDRGGASGGGGGNVDVARDAGVSRFRGSARPIINPLESLMERSFNTAQLIAHNDALKALATLADKAGIGAGKLVERVPAKEVKATYVDPLEALRNAGRDAGMTKTDIDAMVTAATNILSVNGQKVGPVSIFRSEQAAARGENLVFFLDGGKMQALRLIEGDFGRQLVDTMTAGLSSPLRDWNLQALAALSRVLRLGVVTEPAFFLANIVRDQLGSWVLNRGTLPFFDAGRGIARELAGSELARAYSQVGGIAGGVNVASLDKALVEKDLQALAKKGFVVSRLTSWEGLFKTIELSETATRLGIFERAFERGRKQGLTDYEAAIEGAFAGTDFIDFGRHGSRMGDTLKLVPFFNANIQGLDKAGRALLSPLFREALTTGDVEARKTLLSAYAKITALAGLSMALRALYIDDPEYNEISDYMRNTHWMVKVPGLKSGKIIDASGKEVDVPAGVRGLWVAIPKPFELAIIPNLGERAVEMLNDKDPRALTRWAKGALDLISPRGIMESTGIKLFAEVKSGKNFYTGRDIVPDYLKGLEPWAQASAATSEFSKTVSKSLEKVGGNVSPMVLDHIVRSTGGGWGRDLLNLTDQAMGTKGDRSLADTAVAMRFFKEAYRGATSTGDFYDAIGRENGKLVQAANTYDSFLKAGKPSEADSFLARQPDDKRTYIALSMSPFDETRDELKRTAGHDKLFARSELSGDAVIRRATPMFRAQLAMTAITHMTREIADRNLIGEADREPIPLTSSEQRVALDVLSRIRMWEARNALIVSEAEGMKGKKLGNVQAEFDMLKQVAPQVYDELAQRYANAKVYTFEAVQAAWPVVKQEIIDNGSHADLAQPVRDVAREGFELGGSREKARRTRPQIPGRINVEMPGLQ